MKFNVLSRASILAGMISLSSGAWATDVVSGDVSIVIEPVAEGVVVASQSDEDSSWGVAVSVANLDGYRGGFDFIKNDMQLSGTVANNSTYNVVSGNNLITQGSFANSSGFPTVVQNSGSNVLIQNATIINLQYE